MLLNKIRQAHKLSLANAIVLILILFLSNDVMVNSGGKVFIFSGYKGSTNKALYHQIGIAFRKKGVNPVFVEIDWETDDIMDYVNQGRIIVQAEQEGPIYFYGFSMGGLIALSLCQEFAPKSVIVSSVAPFFEEDILPLAWFNPHKIYNWYLFGDSKSTVFEKLVTDINSLNTQVEILVGTEENSLLIDRSRGLSARLIRGNLIEMEGVSHGLSKPNHINYVIDAVNRLN